MNINLVRKLVAAGIIHENTEIEATYNGIDLSGAALANSRGTFALKAVKVNEKHGRVFFDTVSTVDGRPRLIKDVDVLKIDGMDLPTIGSIYGMDPRGAAVPQGKRRGRKPGTAIKKPTPAPVPLDPTLPVPKRRGRPLGSKTKKPQVISA